MFGFTENPSMNLFGPLFLSLMASPVYCFFQLEKNDQFLQLGSSDITIVSVGWIYPNLYSLGYGNYVNGDLKQSFRIKEIPFELKAFLNNKREKIIAKLLQNRFQFAIIEELILDL